MRGTALFWLTALSFCTSLTFATSNQWIGHFRAELSERETTELANYFQVERRFGPHREFVLLAPTGRQWPVRMLEKYFDLFQPNYLYRALGSDPDLEKSWGLINRGQPAGDLGVGTPGKDVGLENAAALLDALPVATVAVIDSGSDLAHEDLKNILWKNTKEIAGNNLDDDGNGYVDDVNGWNFVQNNKDVNDDNGHGSLVAGIIGGGAGNGKGSRGVLSQVRILPLKALDSQGMGTTQGAIDAITYAVKAKVPVVNISWGGTHYDPALYEAMKWAGQQGVLFTVAAGNDGKDNDHDSLPVYPASFRLPNVVTVAAYDNKDQLATFSNYGPETVHVGAPGVQIYGPGIGGYRFADGTSFAAPFAAAVAAAISVNWPSYTVAQVRSALLQSSEVIHYYQKEKTESAGRVDVYNALKAIRPPRPIPPASWSKVVDAKASEHPYANKAMEVTQFRYPGATHVRVHFTRLETEECCDRIFLRDGAGKEITAYTGDRGEFLSADALGDTLEVVLQSDFSIAKFGFEIDYAEVSYQLDDWLKAGPLAAGLPAYATLWKPWLARLISP